MTDSLYIAVAQLNPVVGDIDGNVAKIRAAHEEAERLGADLVVFSELAVCGYPPEDLVLKPFFLDKAVKGVAKLVRETGGGGPAMLIGAPVRQDGGVYNAALLIDGGEVVATRFKRELPNYGVFDEKRVFAQGPLPGPVNFRGVRLGLLVCEDMWAPDVTECLEESGAELLVVINGSPWDCEKDDIRLRHARERVAESGLPMLYVNQVCGQDELVFDGSSFGLASDGEVCFRGPAWREDVFRTAWVREDGRWRCIEGPSSEPAEGLDGMYRAMMLGLSDYVRKNGFPGVALGLSGGIDSALSAAVAVDALGADRVWTVMMPSPYTSQASLDDAAECARLLGTRLDTISIEPAMDAFREMLAPIFGERPPDTTEENIQARARGVALMGISNKFGHMVLSTGNKSEMSVGYATLYGDMAGGYSVLKDVYKTEVFRLSEWRNRQRPEGALGPEGRVIPENIITKPPSAELKPDQTDQDTLPPYDELDDILHSMIELDLGAGEIAARGHAPEVVQRVWRMLDLAEYKRRQAPPGVKLTRRAFGKDRRYPITNAFRGQI